MKLIKKAALAAKKKDKTDLSIIVCDVPSVAFSPDLIRKRYFHVQECAFAFAATYGSCAVFFGAKVPRTFG